MRRTSTRGLWAVALVVIAAMTLATAVPASAGTVKGRRAKVTRVHPVRRAPTLEDLRRHCATEASRRQWVLAVVKAKVAQATFLDEGQIARLQAGVDGVSAQLSEVERGIAAATTADALGALCREFAVDRVIWAVYLPQVVFSAQLAEANRAYERLVTTLDARRAAGADTSAADAALADARAHLDAIVDSLASVTPAMLADQSALMVLWDGVKAHVAVIVSDLVSVARLLPGK